ncbi:head maturation protease, ClpP-related [Cellulosilyticum sp. I15G10I2]|uniref:head maturation protease, ClpP-related n=1 Tax=Cellulosilyticum sp. I15G10I2 TaxID=1892843 RepID=UPI00085C3433|nr:head maturation protease, ClpP-related [Cellulosilyticum sp. I15G10I2]
MKVINIKGRIIGDGSKWIYELFNIPHTSPSTITSGLQEANGDDVEIYVNSGGGSVYDGYEIYNAISEYKGNVTIKIVGLAASAASFASMPKNAKCYMSPLSEMMIHNSSTYAEGPHQAMDETSNMLRVTDSTIAQAYVLKSGKPASEIKDLMEKETWLTAEQAKELGLIDGIMFDVKTESNPVPTLYNAIPINDDLLMSELEKCKSVDEIKLKLTENIDKVLKLSAQNQPTVINTVVDNKLKEGSKMTLENFKTDHPEIYDQIVQDTTNHAITAERNRIKAINDLAMPGIEDIISNGIDNGESAEKVAMNIIKAQKEQGQKYLNDLQNDATAANLGTVSNAAAPQNNQTKEAQDAESANFMAQIMNGGK